jgi:thiol-disulfide isomerase/thioredoxin
MEPTSALVVVLGLVAAATVLGLVWRSRQGHISHPHGETVVRLADVPGVTRLARGATLLQFSTEVCSPCAVTRTVLGDVASNRRGVAHVDLDVTNRPDLASQFRIMQTPTTLILDGKGVIRARIGGAPRRDAVDAEIDRILALA